MPYWRPDEQYEVGRLFMNKVLDRHLCGKLGALCKQARRLFIGESVQRVLGSAYIYTDLFQSEYIYSLLVKS